MDRIKAFFVKAWHDPVGSQVISWAIIAIITALALWAKSGFSGSPAVILASTRSIWTWLKAPTSMPVGVALLTLIAFAALYRWLVWQNHRTLRELRSGLALAMEAEAQIRSSVALTQRAAPLVPNTGPPLPPVESLDPKSFELLRHLAWRYPEGLSTRVLSIGVVMSYAQAEQALESLEANGYIQLVRGSVTESSGWKLTQAGRNFCTQYVAPKG
jgi:hypothetical protein